MRIALREVSLQLENELADEWLALSASAPLESSMRLAKAGLIGGVGTIVAPTLDLVTPIELDERSLALLAAAHLGWPSLLGLAHLGKAAAAWRAGDEIRASMHLALSGLSRLRNPRPDAQRLFLADQLIRRGIQPKAVAAALGLGFKFDRHFAKYSPDQPRVPAGSGRTSGEWTTNTGAGDGAPQNPANHTPTTSSPGPAKRIARQTDSGHAPKIKVELSGTIARPSLLQPASVFTDAVNLATDNIEVADSVARWQELGPKGEFAVELAIEKQGYTVVGRQVYVRTSLGLRVADFMVLVPAGQMGSPTPYYGFLEVKVNGGRYSSLQQAKDALIGTQGGTLVRGVGPYEAGSRVVLETGLARVTITYEPVD
ncbi:MAG TPA: hypothetical protein VGL58_04705 [Caulobacteraceae bacterium]